MTEPVDSLLTEVTAAMLGAMSDSMVRSAGKFGILGTVWHICSAHTPKMTYEVEMDDDANVIDAHLHIGFEGGTCERGLDIMLNGEMSPEDIHMIQPGTILGMVMNALVEDVDTQFAEYPLTLTGDFYDITIS